ncbi:hypothetical protein D3C72_1510730 [compost metagenome]
MHADVRPRAHARQGLALRENLGVGTDADLQILAPGAGFDQGLFQRRRFRRTGLQTTQIVTHQITDMIADARRRRQVAARPLLDHPLQHGGDEGHARRLHRLKVDGRQEPGPRRIARLGIGIGQDVRQSARILARRPLQDRRRISRFAQVASGGKGARHIGQTLAVHAHHRRALNRRRPDTSEQKSAVVGGQNVGRRQAHQFILSDT